MTFRTNLRAPALWALVALFAAEFFLFDRFGAHRFTAVYPRWNDQIQYLGEAYQGHEYARAHGLPAGLWFTLVNPSAQGTLHDFAATLIFALAGPSRSAALALNLLALLAWQASLYLALVRPGGPRLLALAGAALPLALCGPWADIPGSAYDFRLDHLALCALGVTSALAVLADGFRSRRWTIAFGAAVGFTLVTRFLTGTYFGVILVGSAVWILSGTERKRRTLNLSLAMLFAVALAAPVFWINRDTIWNYYWIGHYVGPESAIRNQRFGLGQSLAFVWGQLAQRHLGLFFGCLAVGGAGAFALARGRSPTLVATSNRLLLPGALFLLAPALVLTLHQQKSEVVVGALAPGVVLLVLAAWQAAARPGASPRAHRTVALGLVLAAFAFFAHRQFRTAFSPEQLAHCRQVTALADTIQRRSRAAALPEVRVAVDHITDALDAQVLRVVCYERHHVWLPFTMTLPSGIAEPDEPDVMARLARSDFVFLTEGASRGGYPYDQKLAALRPPLRAWCEAHLRAAERLTLFDRRMVLYQRREIPFP